MAGTGGIYSINFLADDVYYPVGALDSNGDGSIDPDFGDALGAFGADLSIGDLNIDSVTVAGGNTVSGIDFPLYDTVAISGVVSYTGVAVGPYRFYVGVFNTTGFDINNIPEPDFSTENFWPDEPEYQV